MEMSRPAGSGCAGRKQSPGMTGYLQQLGPYLRALLPFVGSANATIQEDFWPPPLCSHRVGLRPQLVLTAFCWLVALQLCSPVLCVLCAWPA